MIKAKFWRIENIVLMKILEQEEFKSNTKDPSTYISRKNEIFIRTGLAPNINLSTLFVRGELKDRDNFVVSEDFNSESEAKNYLKRYIEAIKEYNLHYEKITEETDGDDVSNIEIITVK